MEIEVTRLRGAIVDLVERGEEWLYLLEVDESLVMPVYSTLGQVETRNPADLLLRFPVPFQGGEQFAEMCTAVLLGYLEKLDGFPQGSDVPVWSGTPAQILAQLASWVHAQMPRESDRRLTLALLPPKIEDCRGWAELVASLRPVNQEPTGGAPDGPAAGWIVRVPDLIPFCELNLPGVMSASVTLPAGVGMPRPKTPEQRVQYAFISAKLALSQGKPEKALAWCSLLERHPAIGANTILLGHVLFCEGDALRAMSNWEGAHRRYQLALTALMEEPGGVMFLGGVLTALAATGKVVGDPLVPTYVEHAKRFRKVELNMAEEVYS